MIRKTYTPEQIINKLRDVEALISQGATIMEASRKIGVTKQTCIIAGAGNTAGGGRTRPSVHYFGPSFYLTTTIKEKVFSGGNCRCQGCRYSI